MTIQIQALAPTHTDELTENYLRRYQDLHKHNPILRPSVDADRSRSKIDYLASNCPGVVALEGGKIVGCLAGYLIDGFKIEGKGVYCPEIASFALGQRPQSTFKALYTAMCNRWKEEKVACQVIAAMDNDRGLRDALGLNEFGVHVMDCIRFSKPVNSINPIQYEIRRATEEDVQAYIELNDLLFDHIISPPISQFYPQRRSPELMTQRFHDPERQIWVAMHQDKTIGFIQCEKSADDICYSVQFNGSAPISGAYVLNEHRGSGIAEALLNELLTWTKANGYERTSVDFESTNAQAHGFWTKHFTPVVHSYIRRLDARSVQ